MFIIKSQQSSTESVKSRMLQSSAKWLLANLGNEGRAWWSDEKECKQLHLQTKMLDQLREPTSQYLKTSKVKSYAYIVTMIMKKFYYKTVQTRRRQCDISKVPSVAIKILITEISWMKLYSCWGLLWLYLLRRSSAISILDHTLTYATFFPSFSISKTSRERLTTVNPIQSFSKMRTTFNVQSIVIPWPLN